LNDPCASCGHDRAAHETDTGDARECSVREGGEGCICLGWVRPGKARFGGSNEIGPSCACGRVCDPAWKACPWCGARMDDLAAQLAATLDTLAERNEQSAATKESQGDRYPGERRKRTADRLRARAAQQRARAAWVRGAREALAGIVALDGRDRPPEEWEQALATARALLGGGRT